MQMTIDPDPPPHPHVISTVLGEFQIPEGTLPPLTIPTVSVPSRVLKKVSEVLNYLIDMAIIAPLASMLVSMPIISSPLSPSASFGSLIAPLLLPYTTLSAATEQLPMSSAIPPASTLVISLLEEASIPVGQAVFFALVSSTVDPTAIGLSTASVHPPILADLTMRQLIDRVMAGATKAVGKGKTM